MENKKDLQDLYKKAISYFCYGYKIITWRFTTRCRKLSFIFSDYSDSFRRIILIVTPFAISFFIIQSVNISSLANNLFATYLITVGAMTGGIISIVFTLSIFAQQNAADLYSSQYFEVYAHDWKEKFIYGLIVIITLIFFGLGVFFYTDSQVITEAVKICTVYFSLFLIGLIFALVDRQYENIRRKVNPINALTFLEKQAIKFLNSVHKDAKRIAKIIKAKNTETSEELALVSVYNNYLFPHLTNLDRQIENLFEISMKLSERQEIKTTNRGLSAVHNILTKYFELRKTSSMALASRIDFFVVESDSQSFLTKTFERFNNTGEKFIRSQKVENAIFIIDIYKSLAKNSKEIEFINRENENPIFDQTKGYFILYLEFAIREKNHEIVFQSAQALNHFALIAVEKNLQASLFGIQKNFQKLANFGVVEKKTFIVDECFRGWLLIIQNVFMCNFFVAKFAVSEALKDIKDTTVYVHMAIKTGYLEDNFTSRMTLSRAYDEMMVSIHLIINNFFELKDGKEKSYYKSNIIELFEELCSSLRRLSEEINDCDSTLIDSIGRLIFNINSLIINLLEKDEFNDGKDDLLKQLGWNIHLPYWFFHHAENFESSNALNTLTDSVVKTGLLLFKTKDNEKLIMDCVNSLYSITKQSLEKTKGGSGCDEPRIMKKIVYLGVLALKHNKQDILIEVGLKIYEFEELYKVKYLSNLKLPKGVDPDNVIGMPKKDQLYQEIFKWRDDFARHKYNRHGLMDDAKDKMFELIDELDIDRFMFEVWSSFPAHSSIQQEIEEKYRKKIKQENIAKLIMVLKSEIAKHK